MRIERTREAENTFVNTIDQIMMLKLFYVCRMFIMGTQGIYGLASAWRTSVTLDPLMTINRVNSICQIQ